MMLIQAYMDSVFWFTVIRRIESCLSVAHNLKCRTKKRKYINCILKRSSPTKENRTKTEINTKLDFDELKGHNHHYSKIKKKT